MSNKLAGLSSLLVEEKSETSIAMPETKVSRFLDSINFRMSGKIPELESRAESWKKSYMQDIERGFGDYYHYGQRYDYTRLKVALYYSLQDLKSSFIRVGQVLCMMRDAPNPFCSTYEIEAATFGLSKSSVYALMGVYERFGTESGELKPEYQKMSYSALVEWLPFTDDEIAQYKGKYTTVSEIRAFKKSLKTFQTSGKTEENQKPVEIPENQISFSERLNFDSSQAVQESSRELQISVDNQIDIEIVCEDIAERYNISDETALTWLCTALQSNVIMEELVKQIDFLLEQGQLSQ